MRANITAMGCSTVIAALQQMRSNVSDRGAMMEAIGAKIESNVNLRFDTKKDPSGNPWAPLKESTLERYRREDTDKEGNHSRAGTILERTRLMRQSLSHDSGPDFAAIGFGRPYAGYHEYSTRRMVRRGMLTADPNAGTLGAEDERDILDIAAQYMSRGVKT